MVVKVNMYCKGVDWRMNNFVFSLSIWNCKHLWMCIVVIETRTIFLFISYCKNIDEYLLCGSRALAWILSQTINFLSLAPNFFGAHIFAGALDLIIPTIKGSANTSINDDQARGADLWFLTGRGSAWVICGGLIWRRESWMLLEVSEFLHHQYLLRNCNEIS